MFWILTACTGPATPATQPATPPNGVERGLQLTTRDDVGLVADLYAGDAGSKAIVLLHMTPAGPWDRSNWPVSFIERLSDHGWWVLALDRRGAGDSGGVGEDAFTGPAGKYDVEAAVNALTERGAGPLVVIGASNGTTSALDYALWAASEGLPVPVGLGFMTGGAYTENQNALSGTIPAIFTYSTAERAWSVGKEAGAPTSWVFKEYEGGDHGTLMFDAKPEVEADLEAWLDGL